MSDPRRELFRNANFRWIIGGGLLSMLGDQFTLLALPWLVMGLSRDPLVLGTVLALSSLPRAILAVSGLKTHWRLSTLGGTVLPIDTAAGAVFLAFGPCACGLAGRAAAVALGALGGFVQVAVYSWLQKRIPPEMLGRSMALFMFIVMGLAPLASAAAGAALRALDVTQLFTAAALCLLGGCARGGVHADSADCVSGGDGLSGIRLVMDGGIAAATARAV
jgi:hypothetical protein